MRRGSRSSWGRPRRGWAGSRARTSRREIPSPQSAMIFPPGVENRDPRSSSERKETHMAETMVETKALGKFVWRDLMTTDPARAREFYTALVGWSYNEVDMGTSKYPMIHAAGEDHG